MTKKTTTTRETVTITARDGTQISATRLLELGDEVGVWRSEADALWEAVP